MARASQTTQPMVLPGLAPTLTAPSVDGDIVDVGRVFVMVKNAGAAAATVTVETPELVDGDLAVADRAVSIAAGATALIPITSAHYKQTTTSADSPADVNRAYVTYAVGGGDTLSDITRGVISL
jgi:hypothetical protein